MEFVPKASKIIERMISIRLKEEEVQHLDDKIKKKKMHHKSNNIVWTEIEQGGILNHLRAMLMHIWLLIHIWLLMHLE